MDMVCPADVFCAYCKRKYRFCSSPEGDGRDDEALSGAAGGPSPPALLGHIVPIGSASAKLTGAVRGERSTPSPAPSAYHTAGSYADGGAQSRGADGGPCAQPPSHHDASLNPYARPRLRVVGTGARDRLCADNLADCETGSTTLTAAAEAAATAARSSLGPPGAHVSSASAAGAHERPHRSGAGTKRRSACESPCATPPADDVAAPPAKRSRADGATAGGASVRPRQPRRSGAHEPAAEALGVVVCWAQCDACEAWRVTGQHDVSKWSSFTCATIGRECGQPDDPPPAAARAARAVDEEVASEAVRRAALRARYNDSVWPHLDELGYFGRTFSAELLAAFDQLGQEADAAARCVAAAAGAVSTVGTGAASAEAAVGAQAAGAQEAAAARSPAEGGGDLSDGEQTTDSHVLMQQARQQQQTARQQQQQAQRVVHSEEDADSPRGWASDGEQTTARQPCAREHAGPPEGGLPAGLPPLASSLVLQLDAAIERRGERDRAPRPAGGCALLARGPLAHCRFVPPADARASSEARRRAASEAELLSLADAAETPSWSLDALLPAAGDDQDGLWASRRRQRPPSPSPPAMRTPLATRSGVGAARAAEGGDECESDGSRALDSFLTILALHPTGSRLAWAREAEAEAQGAAADCAPLARDDAPSGVHRVDETDETDSLELRLLKMQVRAHADTAPLLRLACSLRNPARAQPHARHATRARLNRARAGRAQPPQAQLDKVAAETAATRAQLCAAALVDRQTAYAIKCAAGEVLVTDECETAPTPPAAQSPRETQAEPCAFPAPGRGPAVS
jgi:hypothetical protein